MDWLFDPRNPGAAATAKALLAEHLQRHATRPAAVPEAAEVGAAPLHEGIDGAEAPVWVHLDWAAPRPQLTVHRLSTDADASLQEVGLVLDGHVAPRHHQLLAGLTERSTEAVTLPVEREPMRVYDADPDVIGGLDLDLERDGVAVVPVVLLAAAQAHPAASAAQLASFAGATLADVAARDRRVETAEDVAQAFVDAHRMLGGTTRIESADESGIELVVDVCPFGASVRRAPAACGVSAALAGRLAARVNGRATVVLEEAVAEGDPVCRLRITLAGADQPESEGRVFHWPSTEPDNSDALPHMDLTVALPRETSSVPVVRRLAGQALRAFGVVDEHIDDVQLAITEACANVIDHAVDTETYEVRIELGADQCAITVVDQGAGFDSEGVPANVEDHAETGRGLRLMRALVDNLAFEEQPAAGAVVRMVKQLDYDSTHPLHALRM